MKNLSMLLLAIATIFFASCTSDSGSKSPADVAAVPPITPSAMASSGASVVPSDLAATKSAISGALNVGGDVVMNDIGGMLKGTTLSVVPGSPSIKQAPAVMSKVLGIIAKSGAQAKGLSSDITTQLQKIKTDISNFPTTKSLSESLNLSGDALGTYFTLTTATCSFSASCETQDGSALAPGGANLKSATGTGSMSIVVDPVGLPASSVVKDLKLRINAGGSATLGSTANGSGGYKAANLAFDYGESAALAMSLNNGGTGGKFVITATAKNSATIVDPNAVSDPSAYAPAIYVTLAVYNDAGGLVYSKVWTDLTALEADFSGK